MTIDPGGNWELVYDAWDYENDKVRIKYFNSGSPFLVTLIEYQECWEGPSCPSGTIADLEGITSARDSTGKLHVAYGFESPVDYTDVTYYMYMDDTSVGADFTAQVTSGSVPLTVNFTDQSCGTITSWQWSFGDEAVSNAQNPSHTFSKPGTYTVSLTVTGPGGSDTETETDFISVRAGMPGIPLLLLED
jgi:PKD repeat protein